MPMTVLGVAEIVLPMALHTNSKEVAVVVQLPCDRHAQYTRVRGVGEVGWFAPGDNLKGDRNGTPKPAWALGPSNAVTVEMKMRGCR